MVVKSGRSLTRRVIRLARSLCQSVALHLSKVGFAGIRWKEMYEEKQARVSKQQERTRNEAKDRWTESGARFYHDDGNYRRANG